MTDFRLVPPSLQEYTRRQIVDLSERGMSAAQIAVVVGVHLSSVYRTLRVAREGGVGALAARRRGPSTGEGRVLSQAQEERLVGLIVGNRPDQLMIDTALWSRESVQELVWRECKVSLALRSVSRYLERWGFSAKKPVWRVYLQREEAVKAFVEKTYPALLGRARSERAKIFFLDESGLRVDDVRGRAFAPVGKRAVALKAARKQQVSVIHAVARSGQHVFQCYTGTLNSERFCAFLTALRAATNARKLIVVLDNLAVHHSNETTRFLSEQGGRIELVFLPAYAPELNVVEYANNDLKDVLTRQRNRPRTTSDLAERVTQALQAFSDRPSHVKRWFHAAPVKYTLARLPTVAS